MESMFNTIIDNIWSKLSLKEDDSSNESSNYKKISKDKYIVIFTSKPLNLTLVGSCQLYGVWEISENNNSKFKKYIKPGDVLVSINGEYSKACLRRHEFKDYLNNLPVPIQLCFRRPTQSSYHTDSHSIVTSMYPSSHEYNQKDVKNLYISPSIALNTLQNERSIIRATASQWKTSLEEDLNDLKNIKNKKNESITFNTLGEFDYIFPSKSLGITLVPSTRIYGSMEIDDPRDHSIYLKKGDVIISMNGHRETANWTIEKLKTKLEELEGPITIRFRRPYLYNKYLNNLLLKKKKRKKEAFIIENKNKNNDNCLHNKLLYPSVSLSKAMFPETKEYKNNNIKSLEKKQTDPTELIIEEKPNLNKWKEIHKIINEKKKFKYFESNSKISCILRCEHMTEIVKEIPLSLKENKLSLIYSTQIHGWNMYHFYELIKNKGPSIIVVKDINDFIFGVFASCSLKHSNEIYGNGETFVFRLFPDLKIYHWSGINDNFLYGKHNALFVGGGIKGFALCIELDNESGFSQSCLTFDNPSLSSQEHFRCYAVEAWSFQGFNI